MLNNQKVLAIIPARGGSKRLPRKNVMQLNGKALISWTIEAARGCPLIDAIVVSSDDPEVLEIASQSGVKGLQRPEQISGDSASTFAAISHALVSLPEHYDVVILLQPTSPLRKSFHITGALSMFSSRSASAVISVTKCEHSPLWANTLPPDGSMDNFVREEVKGLRSQDLPDYYRLNGAIYIAETKKLIEEETFFLRESTFAYVMDKEFSVDIDEKMDFAFAEYLMKNQ